jgi:hypothetical protein
MRTSAALGQAKAARSDQIGDTVITSTATISPGIPNAQAPDPLEVFRERCEARALLFANGQMSLHEAVDELQNAAVGRGLIDLVGQDQVQAIMGAAFATVRSVLPSDWPGRSCRTAKSTIDAFWSVVSLNDPDRLKAWLRQHPGDAPTLLKLLESKL